jgi:signal transduction histidine kinase
LAFGTAACVILLAANWINYFESRSALETQLNYSVIRELQDTGHQLDLFIKKCGARCDPIVSRELANRHTPDELRSFLVDLLARTPTNEAFDFYITYEKMDYRDPDSDLVVDRLSWPKTYYATYDYHEARQEWYHVPKVTQLPHLTEPYYDLGSVNQSMVSYTIPLLDASNQFLGVAGVDILLTSITNLVAQLDVIPGRDTSQEHAFVVSKAGKLISHPNAGLLPSRSFAGTNVDAVPEGKFIRNTLNGFAMARIDGEQRRIYWATAPFTEWKVVLNISQQALMGPINALTKQMAGGTVITLGAMMGMIYLLARRMSRPLRELAHSTRQLASKVAPAATATMPADEIGMIDRSVRHLTDYQKELDRANRELESFAYSISHDLRAPLRAISGFCAILQEDYGAKLDAEGQEICGYIQSGVREMSQLIDDLLKFSRLSRAPMKVEPVNMRELAAAAFATVAADAPAQPAAVFDLGPLPEACGDAALLRQVWINLLSNAVKFSARREQPRIVVAGEGSGKEAIFTVQDNGAGFDPQHAGKLFGVFQRLHRSSEFEGTGVGLAIVHRIVERHGGRIWAEGKPGVGATFHFALPVSAPKPGPGENVSQSRTA